MNTRDDKLQYINELSFFKLFFTHELIDMICLYTNRYDPAIQKLECVAKTEMYRYISLLFYVAIVNLPRLNFIKVIVLSHGTWARSFTSSMKRFKLISGFLKVQNFDNEDKTNKM